MFMQEKELRYKISIVGETADADRVMEETAKSVDKITEAATKAQDKIRQMGKVGGGAAGGTVPVSAWTMPMPSAEPVYAGAGNWTAPSVPAPGKFPAIPVPESPAEKAKEELKAKSKGGAEKKEPGAANTSAPDKDYNKKDMPVYATQEKQKAESKGLMESGRELQGTFLRLAGSVTAVVGTMVTVAKVNTAYAELKADMESGSWRQRYDKFLSSFPVLGGVAKSILDSEYSDAEREVMGDKAFYRAVDKIALHPFRMAHGEVNRQFESANNAISDRMKSDMVGPTAGAAFAYQFAYNMHAPEMKTPGMIGPPMGNRYDNRKEYDSQIRSAVNAELAAKQNAFAANNQTFIALQSQGDSTQSASALSSAAKLKFREARHAVDSNGPLTIQSAALLSDAEAANADYTSSLAQKKSYIESSYEAQKNAIIQQSAAAQAGTRVKEARLNVVDSKIATNESAQVEFATSDWQKQQGLVEAARVAQARGFDVLSPEQKQMLLGSSATGEWAKNKAIESGENNDNLKDIWAITGQQDTETLKKDKRKLEAEIEVEYVLNKEKLAKMMKELTNEMKKALQDVGIEIRDAELSRIETARMRARITP